MSIEANDIPAGNDPLSIAQRVTLEAYHRFFSHPKYGASRTRHLMEAGEMVMGAFTNVELFYEGALTAAKALSQSQDDLVQQIGEALDLPPGENILKWVRSWKRTTQAEDDATIAARARKELTKLERLRELIGLSLEDKAAYQQAYYTVRGTWGDPEGSGKTE
jgi:hypothetical protein